MEKKLNFKRFLATASAFAVIAGASTNAMGNVVDTTGDAVISDGSGANLSAVFSSGNDSIRLGGAHNLSTGSNLVFAAPNIAINGNAGQTFTINHDVTFAAAALAMNVVQTAGTLTFNHDVTEDVTVQGGTFNARDLTGAGVGNGDLTVNGGVANVRGVARHVNLAGAGVVNITGAIGGNVATAAVSTSRIVGANATDVTGSATINTTNDGMNTLHNVGGDVTLTAGRLTINNALSDVTVTAGEFVANDLTGGAGNGDLTVNGGTATVHDVNRHVNLAGAGVVNITGAIGGNVATAKASTSLIVGDANANVVGTATINTTNDGMNTLHNVGGNVTLTAGKLTINNALSDVTVTAGEFVANDLTGTGGNGDLTVNGGTARVNDVAGAIATANGALVTANDVTGAVVINTDSEEVNTLNDVTGNVTLTKGKLTMNDADSDVTVTAGEFVANDLTGGTGNGDLTVNGGTARVNDVAGAIATANGALVTANDVTGAVVINTDSEEVNTLRDAKAAVTLTKGKLKIRNSTTGGDVNINGGFFEANDITAGNLIVSGGSAEVHDVTKNVTVNKGSLLVNKVSGNITVDGANTPVALVTTEVVGNVALANAGELSVGTDITGTLNGAGTITLTDVGTVTGKVGGVTKVTKVVAQADRTFKHATFTVGELAIEGASTVTLTAADLANTTVTTNETDRSQNIVVNDDQNITGIIGTAEKPIGNVIVADAGGNVTVDISTTNFHAGILTENTGATNVNFATADASVINLGSASQSLTLVDFQQNGSVKDGVYSDNVSVAAGKVATLGGVVQSENFQLAGAGSTVKFADGATVDSVITTGAKGEGVVEFLGNAKIEKDLGTNAAYLNKVVFADDATKTVEIGADFYVIDTEMKKSVVKLTDHAGLSNVTTNSTTFDLSNKTLGVFGDLAFSGKNTIKFKMDSSQSPVQGGYIVIDNKAGTLSYANGIELAIEVVDANNSRPVAGKEKTFDLILNEGTLAANSGLDFDKVSFKNAGVLVKWAASEGANGGVRLTQLDVAETTIKENLSKLGKLDDLTGRNIAILTQAAPGTAASRVVGTIGDLLGKNDTAGAAEVTELLSAQQGFGDTVEGVMKQVGEGVSIRATTLAGSQGNPAGSRVVSSGNVTGVSAGDEAVRFGAWFSPFYGQATQKARKGSAGYKDKAYGASFGFDTRVNEDMIIGAAFTTSNNEIKYKDLKSGDNTRINSLLLTIYGLQQITDSWFTQGAVTFGSNEIKGKSKRREVNGYEIASHKYSSMSFSAESMFGYNYAIDGATLTPMFGFRYSRVNDAGYKERGTTNQNLDISTKASNKFEFVLGARVTTGTFDMNGMMVTPEIHASINHDMIGKNSSTAAKLDNVVLESRNVKPTKTSYNFGLGANAQYGMMEYGAGYDINFAEKHLGHQGTLKLRVNF